MSKLKEYYLFLLRHSFLKLKDVFSPFFCNFLKQEYHAAGIAHCCLKLSFFFDSCWPQLSSLRFLIFDSFKTTALVPIILIEQTSCAIESPGYNSNLLYFKVARGVDSHLNSYYLFSFNQLCNKKPW